MAKLRWLTPTIFMLRMVVVVIANTTNMTDSLSLMYEWISTTTTPNQSENLTIVWSNHELNSNSLSNSITTEHYELANKFMDRTSNDASEGTKSTSSTTESYRTSKDYLDITTPNDMAEMNWPGFMGSNESQNSVQKRTNSSFPIRDRIPNVIPVVSVIVGIVVMTFNSQVMVASARNRELRQNTNYNLVMGLSLSDFLMGVCVLFNGFRTIFPSFTRVIEWCIATNMFGLTSLNMSLFQSLCISLHRYLVLSENAWAKHLFDNNRKYYVYISGWVVTFTVYSALISPEEYHANCFYKTVFGPNMQAVRQIMCAFTSSLMFLIVIFYLLAIYQVKRRYLSTTSASTTEQMEERKRKRVMKSIKLVSMILLALYVFSGPMLICIMFPYTPQPLIVGSFAAANINSLLNPIIYCSHITQLRNELRSMFCCNYKK